MMTNEELAAMRNEIDVAGMNLREMLQRHANKLISNGETSSAGALLVFERVAYQHIGGMLHWFSVRVAVEPEPDERPARKRSGSGTRAPKGQGAHRHKFNSAGICDLAVNGKMCAEKRRRAPKGSGDAAERTVPMPFVPSRPTLGEHERDPFEDGAMGSSGVTRR